MDALLTPAAAATFSSVTASYPFSASNPEAALRIFCAVAGRLSTGSSNGKCSLPLGFWDVVTVSPHGRCCRNAGHSAYPPGWRECT